MIGTVIGGEYKLIELIAKSKHSSIYQCISIKSGKEYAAKVQAKGSSSLLREANMLKNIQKQNKIIMDYGLPTCFLTQQATKTTSLVSTLLGGDLQTLLVRCNGRFRMRTFLMVADQMLRRLQFLHWKEYIHRTLTLKKWLVGKGQLSKKIYLVGLGKCKHYLKNGQHLAYSDNNSILNQHVYASVNSHMGIQVSRRDDLQSMFYCWAKMLYGTLPWQNEKDLQKMLSKKIANRSQVLFANFPQALIQIGQHIEQLDFLQDPDYHHMRNLVIQLFSHYQVENNYSFDWQELQKYGEYLPSK